MKNIRSKRTHVSEGIRIWLVLIALVAAVAVPVSAAELIKSDFQKTPDETWPKGWPKISQASWEDEGGNGFLRIESDEPGAMIMLYREIGIPEGTKALRLKWKQRITGLERGENSWFDARIMMEFMNADRAKVAGKPPTPNAGKDTKGWVDKEVTFAVPEDARILKFMPSLFRVRAGTLDLDDVVLETVDTP